MYLKIITIAERRILLDKAFPRIFVCRVKKHIIRMSRWFNFTATDYDDRYNNRYFGKDVEELLFDKKISDIEKFERTHELYEHYEYDDGNPDVHGRIQRPCQVYDTFCIQQFFADHSQCRISGRQVPEPLVRAQDTFNIPSTNVSGILVNSEYKGIKDGRIEEFYINTATDNLVISVFFDRVTFATPNVYLKYYLRGREPNVMRDAGSLTFVKVSVTAVIPNLKNLSLDRAEIFTYSEEPLPPFVVGPGIALSTDPDVVAMFAKTFANLALDGIESQLTGGNFYISNYIQYNICDFGLKAI